MFLFGDPVPAGKYVFLGCQSGSFTSDDGRIQDYRHIFVMSSPGSTSNRDVFGYTSEKLRVSSEDVWKGIDVGSVVDLLFDRYGRVMRVIPV